MLEMLGAVPVHPDCAEVFPLAPAPILKPDGAKKNDSCVLVRLGGGQRAHRRGELRRGERIPPPLPLPRRRAVERRQLRPRGERPRVPGTRPRRQRPPLLSGDRSPRRQHQPDDPDARCPRTLEDRKRDLIDQIQQRCCRLFEAALTAAKSKTRLWRKLRNRFDLCLIQSREVLYRSILHPPQIPLWLDTS
ncbi:hypothetical protein THIOKS1590005 [Thiocapsa sp. KS1]|nr:hypothetical protein THIOKS1590005 [Thiocapsa sp. KS1]